MLQLLNEKTELTEISFLMYNTLTEEKSLWLSWTKEV